MLIFKYVLKIKCKYPTHELYKQLTSNINNKDLKNYFQNSGKGINPYFLSP